MYAGGWHTPSPNSCASATHPQAPGGRDGDWFTEEAQRGPEREGQSVLKDGDWSQPRDSQGRPLGRKGGRKRTFLILRPMLCGWLAGRGRTGPGSCLTGPSEHPLCMTQAQEQEKSLHKGLQEVARCQWQKAAPERLCCHEEVLQGHSGHRPHPGQSPTPLSTPSACPHPGLTLPQSPGKCQPKNTKSPRHRPKGLASQSLRDGLLDVRVL